MDIQDLGSLGEFVAAIATVITLVYLAVQIRLNTSEQRSNSRLATTRLITDWHTTIMSDPELIRVFNAGFLEPLNLVPEDRSRFIWMVAAWASRMEEMYTQHKAGLIDPALWSQYREIMASFLKNPVLKEWWESKVFVCSEEFYADVNEAIGDDEVWNAERMRVLVESTQTSVVESGT
ncbi:MAG: hypothetical protein ACU84Q_20495 [Gammaproteobacteria bacterium]